MFNLNSLTRFGSESTELYLQRVTHLHLQGKRIQVLENLDSCTNLKVLYLYDNQIEKIENLDFAANLEYLQFQNNSIIEIPLLSMPCLMKLFLDDNKISYCSGLEKCTRLEELHLAGQNIPQHVSLQFDSKSLAAISRSLLTLEISNTGIEILSPFTVLKNLRKFFCSNNKVENIDDVKDMVSLRYLTEADFAGNPCCSSIRYRYICLIG
jgi:protein phosphatase 1 regulatory subunit 42